MPVITSVEDVARPIDRYLPTADRLIRLAEVEEVRINTCLEAHGHEADYSLVTPEVVTFIEAAVHNRAARSRMWGLFDTSSDAPHYTLTADEAGVEVAPLPDDMKVVCDPATGTDAEPAVVDPILYALGDVALPDGGPGLPVDDPRFQHVVSVWSDCMSNAGFAYGSPMDPLAEFADVAKGVDDHQLDVARADLACKNETNLVGVAVSILSAYDREYMNRYQEELGTIASALEVDGTF